MPATISALALAPSPARYKIIDIRESEEFATFQPWPAQNIPYDDLMRHPEKFLNKQDVYYLICVNGSVSFRCAMLLEMEGYKVLSVQGGYAVFSQLQITPQCPSDCPCRQN